MSMFGKGADDYHLENWDNLQSERTWKASCGPHPLPNSSQSRISGTCPCSGLWCKLSGSWKSWKSWSTRDDGSFLRDFCCSLEPWTRLGFNTFKQRPKSNPYNVNTQGDGLPWSTTVRLLQGPKPTRISKRRSKPASIHHRSLVTSFTGCSNKGSVLWSCWTVCAQK